MVTWYERLSNLFRGGPRSEGSASELELSGDYHGPSSLPLVPGALKIRVGVVSTVGNVRPLNEDNFYVPGQKSVVDGGSTSGSGELPTGPSEPAMNLLIVADGMGGQAAGEEASRMAVEIIPRSLTRRLAASENDPKAVQTAIREAVAEANQEILGSSGTVTEYSNMGTTVVLLLFRNDRVYVAGIGDSRAYRLRDGKLEQLTKDHSLADALLEAGTISKEELPNHKYKNILYLYLGSKDARGGPEDVRVLDVRAGDRFLLASDGLTGVVSDEQICHLLNETVPPQEAARALMDLALASDSRDNVTCLVIHVIGESGQVSAGNA